MSDTIVQTIEMTGTAAERSAFDTANINPKTRIIWFESDNDTVYHWDGDSWVEITGSYTGAGAGGSGTEYTEDAAAAANPVGGVNILVRQDTPASLVSADGDNVAQRGTEYGAAFIQVLDSSGNFINSFGGGTENEDGGSNLTGTGSLIQYLSGTTARTVKDASQPLPVKILLAADTGWPTFDDDPRVATSPIAGSLSSASGTITTGGTAQTALAASSLREYLFILNPASATEDLAVSLVGTASLTGEDTGSVILSPGDSWTFEGPVIPSNAVSVVATTTGHKFTILHKAA